LQPRNDDHFRNGRFYNPDVRPVRFLDLIRWLRTRQPSAWRKWIPSSYGPKPAEWVGANQLRVTFVGHSTVLIQTGALNVVTDPIWSNRASPVRWAGPKRHRAPGLRFDDLPPLDAILISHDHFDHLDAPTLRRLRGRHRAQIFCPLGVAKLLRKLGYAHSVELDWWQTTECVSGVRIHCTPAQHFSGRSLFGRNRTLWCSWLLETPDGNIYFGADTGFGPHFRDIAQRFPSPRLALLPIGAYRPEWLMSPMHMSPDEAFRAHQILQAQTSVAIHYGTFRLADDGESEAVQRLRELGTQAGIDAGDPPAFLALDAGAGYDVAP